MSQYTLSVGHKTWKQHVLLREKDVEIIFSQDSANAQTIRFRPGG